ncbi:CdaR family transcriptional regulator [Citricoccus sp.]|uniref:PucR family transcriptional regulator n=1 Tax=Citricoccus sp. TaxID=1978372 RepID=UPI002608947C|nr:helix-turn-helix domain-containing protein [Citricoccus sp.]HRO30403.1 helix-turn-helix domain-containing protein [Citricoccus sp.]HRO92470.1 helix-turn-helix domain-containing protein [Citricoccus sp.]
MSASPMSSSPLPEDRDRWLRLLDSLDVDGLTRRFLDAVRQLPDYVNPPIPWSRVAEDAEESFLGLVSALRGTEHWVLEGIATQVGVTRARAGIPLTSLMSAIRLDFALLWEELVALGDVDDMGILLRHAALVSETVETYVQQTQHAYLVEERRMADEIDAERRGLLTELLAEPPVTPARLAQIAERLGVGVEWEYSVYASRDESLQQLRVEAAALERQGTQVLSTYTGSGLVVIVPHPPRTGRARLRRVDQLRVGAVGDVRGMSEVSRAVHLARELAEVLRPGEAGCMTPARGWTRVIRQRLAGTSLREVVDLSPLLAGCGPAERSSVESAVRSYLRTGSIAETSTELFCHRNTVTNRLRRFQELTGIDLTVPDQAARAVIAFS